MDDANVPTTEQIRDYVEAGMAVARPWEEPTPERDNARAAAFDAWLAAHDREVEAKASFGAHLEQQEFYARVAEFALSNGQPVAKAIRGPAFYLPPSIIAEIRADLDARFRPTPATAPEPTETNGGTRA
ncbi:hypothetical protein [Plantibacter sp. YIM 135249]|uniref:hypothetical protein n=1 Tax=Plantibacter sp. YIM 135249 TaxID=3423918 RepID=UPI003D338E64